MSIKEAIISRVKSETENKEREKREPTYVLSREIFRFLQKEFPRITLKTVPGRINGIGNGEIY